MNRLIKFVSVWWIPLVVASCSANTARELRSDPEIFRVGDVEVRLYSDRDAMVRGLPPIFALLAATKVGNTQIQVSGYYDKENKRIYAINDARTVIHEFKHHLEPEWIHGIGPASSGIPQHSHSATPLNPKAARASRASIWSDPEPLAIKKFEEPLLQ